MQTIESDEFARHQPDRIPGVNLHLVLGVAMCAAEELIGGERAVEVYLSPGDSTAYRIVLSKPHRFITADGGIGAYRSVGDGELLVTMLTPDVSAYVWGPANSSWTDWSYVVEHWGCGEWTGRVLAAFLNMLRDELATVPS